MGLQRALAHLLEESKSTSQLAPQTASTLTQDLPAMEVIIPCFSVHVCV